MLTTFRKFTNYDVIAVDTFKKMNEILAKDYSHIAIAIVDVHLPDAKDGEAVETIVKHKIPTIVITAGMTREIHDKMSKLPISDYVAKHNQSSIAILLKSAMRIIKNKNKKVLIVDDSGSARIFLKKLLQTQNLSILEAKSGAEALAILEKEDGEISLMLSDHEMSGMDGIELITQVRGKYSSAQLSIIGVTGSEDEYIGVRFLKSGADDIIRKPFIKEEFIARINNTIEHQEDMLQIQEQANQDFMTKLKNRKYFMEMAQNWYGLARRGQMELTVAMLDIDHFKKINDTYGHDIGDKAIIGLADVLKSFFRKTDLVARMGGEEFCIMAVNMEGSPTIFERLRAAVEELRISLDDGRTIKFTISVGVSKNIGNNLEELITNSDRALYAAKHGGRNRVVCDWLDSVESNLDIK